MAFWVRLAVLDGGVWGWCLRECPWEWKLPWKCPCTTLLLGRVPKESPAPEPHVWEAAAVAAP